MKALILLGTTVLGAAAISYDMHRMLEEVDQPQEQLFTIEQKDIVQNKFTLSPVSDLQTYC